jgi:hypothetical protein
MKSLTKSKSLFFKKNNSNNKENKSLNNNYIIFFLLINFVFGGYIVKYKKNFS